MTRTLRIASLGLLAGAGLTVALAGMANAHGRGGPGMQGAFGAGEPGGPLAQTFAALDADGDGLITEADLRAGVEVRMAAVDTDKSGTLDVDELTAAILTRMSERMGDRMDEANPRRGDPARMAARIAARMIDARDADGDGVVSMAELEPAKGFGRIIDRFDTDDDNAIGKAEYDVARAEIETLMARRAARGGDGHKGGWRDGHHGGKFGGRNN